MASIQKIGTTYYVRFNFAGKQRRRSLDIEDAGEAEAARIAVELTLHRIRTGQLPPPPPGEDVEAYIISEGKAKSATKASEPVTLEQLWDGYLKSLPANAKERSSLATETLHFGHLLRILKPGTVVTGLEQPDLQRYVNRREKEDGHRGKVKARTIKKEITTFKAVWNGYAVSNKIVPLGFKATFGKLQFSKEKEKLPFQTWERIEQRIARGGLDEDQVADLWDSLFLDSNQINEVLTHVRANERLPGWVYPAMVAAAHTGCRRGEIMRAQIYDIDSENGTVQWRERKRDKSKEFTFRPVEMTPRLSGVLSDWLGKHPGGLSAYCDEDRRPLSPKAADYWFGKAVEGSKFAVLRGWHVFRHSFVSCMARAGVDQRTIDATVGHQTEEMRRRYRHLFPKQQREALAAVFGGGS
jgi:integrase